MEKIINIDTAENLKKLIIDRLIIDIVIKENKNQLIKDLNSNNFVEKVIPNNNGFMVHIKNNKYYPEIFEIVKNY